jgi:quercetin dioxygenase-like cupin family protein
MRRLFQLCILLIFLGVNPLVNRAEGQLLNMALPALPENQEILVSEVNLAPGQESSPHRHNAHVFVYVLEGRVNMQVAGGELVTLSPGEMFYENPDDIHAVSQNASDTDPAKFLVHIIKTVGVPVSTPVGLLTPQKILLPLGERTGNDTRLLRIIRAHEHPSSVRLPPNPHLSFSAAKLPDIEAVSTTLTTSPRH